MKRKYISTIAGALRECGLKDGMTLSFHHHLRQRAERGPLRIP